MNNKKVSTDLSNGVTSKPRVSLKFKVILVILTFSLLTGFSLYFSKHFNSLKNLQQNSNNEDLPETSEVVSPFGDLTKRDINIEANSDVSKSKEIEYYVKLYDDYSMGKMGIKYIFKSFDENSMSLRLIEKNESGDVEKNFPLSEDFLIVCTTYDIHKYGLDFSNLTSTDKYLTALKSSSMTLKEKKSRINSYQEGSTFALVFTDMNFDSSTKIKKILVTSSDLNDCYFYE